MRVRRLHASQPRPQEMIPYKKRISSGIKSSQMIMSNKKRYEKAHIILKENSSWFAKAHLVYKKVANQQVEIIII